VLVLDNVTKAFKTGTFGGGTLAGRARRELRDPPRRGDRPDRESAVGIHPRQDDPELTPVTSGTITLRGHGTSPL